MAAGRDRPGVAERRDRRAASRRPDGRRPGRIAVTRPAAIRSDRRRRRRAAGCRSTSARPASPMPIEEHHVAGDVVGAEDAAAHLARRVPLEEDAPGDRRRRVEEARDRHEDDRDHDRRREAVQDAGDAHGDRREDDPRPLRQPRRVLRHHEAAGDEADRRQALLEPVLELGRVEGVDGERQEEDVPEAERRGRSARPRRTGSAGSASSTRVVTPSFRFARTTPTLVSSSVSILPTRTKTRQAGREEERQGVEVERPVDVEGRRQQAGQGEPDRGRRRTS